MDLTNAEFDEIHFETISSDGDASDGDANSEDMDEDELDDVMASMNIADDVIIVPQVQPHRPQVQPPKRPTVPEEEEEDSNGRKGLPNVNRTLVEKVSHLMRMTQQKILEPGFYITRWNAANPTRTVARTTFIGWFNQREELMKKFYSMSKTVHGHVQRRSRGLVKYKELGELVTAWFLHTRDDLSLSVTKKDVLRFADSQSDEFVTISKDAQNLFFTRWRQLNGLVYRRTSSTTQFLPSEWPLIRDRYFGKLRSFLTSVTHDPTQIFQAVIALDETHLCSEPVSPVTLDHIGAKSVRVKTRGPTHPREMRLPSSSSSKPNTKSAAAVRIE